MNVFFFLNADLEDGILYSNNSSTKAQLSELSNISDINFVLPNDLVTHRFHSDQSINIKNIKAAIINDAIIENNNFDSEYIVLGPILESNFLLVEKTNYDLIKSKLSKYGETLKITSDALLLHGITKSDFKFNNYIFKESGGTIFKFQEKMTTLVKGEFKEFDLKKLSNLNTELFVEIDLFTPKSLLNLQKYKFSNYALLAAIILSVFSGLINLININNKISSIDLYQQELFASYFINDAYQDADKIINSYIENAANENFDQLQMLTQSINLLPDYTKIISFKHESNPKRFTITLNLSSAEISMFEEYLKTNNIPLKQIKNNINSSAASITYEYNEN